MVSDDLIEKTDHICVLDLDRQPRLQKTDAKTIMAHERLRVDDRARRLWFRDGIMIPATHARGDWSLQMPPANRLPATWDAA